MKPHSRLLTHLLFAIALILTSNTAYSAHDEPDVDLTATTDGLGLRPQTSIAIIEGNADDNSADTHNKSCTEGCDTAFGLLLGEVDGVEGFSNCQANCIYPKYSFLNLNTAKVSHHSSAPSDKSEHYIGLIYQCVEYARRWWMKNQRITFGDIDSAYEIIYLTEGKNIDTNKPFKLGRSINGAATSAPKRGDLLVYYANPKQSNWQYGHVAVVVAVDLDNGTVSIAEQNYNNLAWSKPSAYSRQLPLFNVAGQYQILDINITDDSNTKRKNINGGTIAGWVYPLETK